MWIQSIASKFEMCKTNSRLNIYLHLFKQLLEGKAHCYVFASHGCKKWDTCSPEAILEADGGILTDIFGKHYNYGPNVEYPNRTGVLATAKGIDHESLLERIPAATREAMIKKK